MFWWVALGFGLCLISQGLYILCIVAWHSMKGVDLFGDEDGPY